MVQPRPDALATAFLRLGVHTTKTIPKLTLTVTPLSIITLNPRTILIAKLGRLHFGFCRNSLPRLLLYQG